MTKAKFACDPRVIRALQARQNYKLARENQSKNYALFGANQCTSSRLFGEGKRRNEFAEWHVAWLAE